MRNIPQPSGGNLDFQGLEVQAVYGGTSGKSALFDFINPALNVAISYDRVAGYFSSQVFFQLAQGMAGFIQNEGKIRLLTSTQLSQADFEVFSLGSPRIDNLAADFELLLEESITVEQKFKSDCIKAMCWMLKNNRLEIRFVVPTTVSSDGFEKFHSKFGILRDQSGHQLVFAGSINETYLAWGKNIENISVYNSWTPNISGYCDSYVSTFNDLWTGKISPDWKTVDMPAALRERLIRLAPEGDAPKLDKYISSSGSESTPERNPRDYQLEALASWEQSGRRGILEMATGTGKTLTARLCIESAANDGSLLAVVVAPYQHISNQWAKELSGYAPTQIGAKGDWRKQLLEIEFNSKLGILDLAVLIVVKNTASSSDFLSMVDKIAEAFDNCLLIGDEVHWLGAQTLQAALNPTANFRLGLSATPNRYFDEEGTDQLFNYFGPSIYTFGLEEALSWTHPITGEIGVLTPYSYHPTVVELNEVEASDYSDLSRKIGQLMGKKDKTPEDYQRLETLRIQRAEIAKSAEAKLPALGQLLDSLGPSITQTLIYCSNHNQMQKAMEVARAAGIDTSARITSLEDSAKSSAYDGRSQREHIIDNFAVGNHQILFAVDCLDEGVDIPSAEIGILLASSGNPKEFIQRRGRLMRKFPGKELARIYDFVVLPPPEFRSLQETEIRRIKEFGQLAINYPEIKAFINETFGEMDEG
jgi:superfamily II DNA or RNA helicase